MNDAILTTACDIYSFGCVMIQVRRSGFQLIPSLRLSTLQTLSGRIPYCDIKNDLRVIYHIFQGCPPFRPPGPFLKDEYWSLIMQCCDARPLSRPGAEMVHSAISTLLPSLVAIPPPPLPLVPRPRSPTTVLQPSLPLHSCDLTGQIRVEDKDYSDLGGYGRVWKGIMHPKSVCLSLLAPIIY